jgi:hypothetical protein
VAGKRIGQVGAACAVGLMLSACSLVGPGPHSFTDQKQAKPDPKALEQASTACKESTLDKGTKSVLAIFTRLRPRAVDQDYISCMTNKGFTVEK